MPKKPIGRDKRLAEKGLSSYQHTRFDGTNWRAMAKKLRVVEAVPAMDGTSAWLRQRDMVSATDANANAV